MSVAKLRSQGPTRKVGDSRNWPITRAYLRLLFWDNDHRASCPVTTGDPRAEIAAMETIRVGGDNEFMIVSPAFYQTVCDFLNPWLHEMDMAAKQLGRASSQFQHPRTIGKPYRAA